MKATQLIALLEAAVAEHGDLECFYVDNEYGQDAIDTVRAQDREYFEDGRWHKPGTKVFELT